MSFSDPYFLICEGTFNVYTYFDCMLLKDTLPGYGMAIFHKQISYFLIVFFIFTQPVLWSCMIIIPKNMQLMNSSCKCNVCICGSPECEILEALIIQLNYVCYYCKIQCCSI